MIIRIDCISLLTLSTGVTFEVLGYLKKFLVVKIDY